MGGKGGGGADPAVSSGGLPEWAQRAHIDLMARAKTESQGEFNPYTGERVAQDSAGTIAGRNAITGLAGGNDTFNSGTAGLENLKSGTNSRMDNAYDQFSGMSSGTNSLMDQGAAGYRGLTSGTNAQMDGGALATVASLGAANGLDNYDQGQYAEFGADAAAKYMSPYQQAVTDVAKRNAFTDYEKANINRNSDMVSRGAFGGSRQAIIQSEADDALSQRMSDLQVQGLQDAFGNAQTQFGADRTAHEKAFQTNSDVDQARMQGFLDGGKQLADIGNTVYSNQSENAGNLFDAGNTQFANQATAAEGMAGIGNDQFTNQAGIANDLVDAGNTQFQNDFKVGQETYDMGKDTEAKDQAQIDADYGDYLTDRDWSKNQQAWYSGIMTGTAPGFTNFTNEARDSNPATNLLGLGTTAIGAAGNDTA